MTPRRFDASVVQARLAHLQRLLDELEQIGPVSFDRLMSESVTRLAVERLLTQFVEVAADTNAYLGGALLGDARVSYRNSFELAVKVGALSPETSDRVAPSAGTRNVLIHEYLDVDYEQIAEAARRAPEDYGQYVREVAAFLLRREEEQA